MNTNTKNSLIVLEFAIYIFIFFAGFLLEQPLARFNTIANVFNILLELTLVILFFNILVGVFKKNSNKAILKKKILWFFRIFMYMLILWSFTLIIIN